MWVKEVVKVTKRYLVNRRLPYSFNLTPSPGNLGISTFKLKVNFEYYRECVIPLGATQTLLDISSIGGRQQ